MFIVPDRSCVWSFVDGVEGKAGEYRAVVGDAGEDRCFGGVWAVGKEQV